MARFATRVIDNVTSMVSFNLISSHIFFCVYYLSRPFVSSSPHWRAGGWRALVERVEGSRGDEGALQVACAAAAGCGGSGTANSRAAAAAGIVGGGERS